VRRLLLGFLMALCLVCPDPFYLPTLALTRFCTQAACLKGVRRLLLAMKVAVVLHDEMLIQEGAVRVYHLLGPLLMLKAKSPMLHKALAKVYISLQVRATSVYVFLYACVLMFVCIYKCVYIYACIYVCAHRCVYI
jgi:uncharacterized membrane protein